jgi:hypothetical protein
VIRLAAQDAEAAIDLLEHEQADEAVRDRELAERDEAARAGAEGVGVAVGPADREGDGRAAAVLGLGAEDVAREREARDRVAALVEGVEVGAVGERGEQGGLVLGLEDLERAVRAQALLVLVLGGCEVRLLEPADRRDDDFQRATPPCASDSYSSPVGRRASAGTSIGTRGASFQRPSRS